MLWILIVYSSIFLQSGSCREESSLVFSARDGKGWGSESSTFFDIALTALAFLSFGVFLLNLLLNALLFPTVPATTAPPITGPILTMITGGGNTGGAIVTGRSQFGKRSRPKRAIFSPEVDPSMSANFLINFVTNSIEMMTQRHECIPRLLCDGNRQSRVMEKTFQVLFPAISMGISYIGKFLGFHNDTQTHITAILLGASEANCKKHFHACN